MTGTGLGATPGHRTAYALDAFFLLLTDIDNGCRYHCYQYDAYDYIGYYRTHNDLTPVTLLQNNLTNPEHIL
jgi:hypothetical protein